MNIDSRNKIDKEDKPLTRADVEALLHRVGNSEQLNLLGQNLREIDLSYFNLPGAYLSGANLNRANLNRANLREAKIGGANLYKANLYKANLHKASLHKANLREACLSGADLSGAYLREADLSGADLSGAYLREAYFAGADLSRTNLSGAYLGEANFRDANLSGADLSGADLSGAELKGIRGFDESKGNMIEHQADFRIRIVEEPLTPFNLTLIILAITELVTKCWLISNERFADLITYTQTHDVRFIEETRLILTRVTYNSPFDASFKLDLTPVNFVEGVVTGIDGVMQAKQRLQKAELENWEKAQLIGQTLRKADQEDKLAQLELERQELAIERERLEIMEKRLDVEKKRIEYALEIASKMVEVLHPATDEQTKAMLMQTLLPTLLQLQNGKGLELVLPAPPRSEERAIKPENG